MKKRVLVITSGFYPAKTYGGPVASIDNLIESMQEEIEFHVVTSNHELKSLEPLPGIKSGWQKKYGAKILYLADNEMTYKMFNGICDEIQPDSIYLNAIFCWRMTLKMLKVAKRRNIRCVLAVRGGLSENALQFGKMKKLVYLKYIKTQLGRNFCFQSTSLEETKAIKKKMGNKRPIYEISNMPKPLDFTEVPLKSYKNVGSVRLIYVSRIHPIKNLDYILNVLRYVRANVVFDIYGPRENEEYWNKCKNIIEELDSNIQVNYCGYLEHSEMHNTYKDYDLFVLPTQTENFGHAIAEALYEKCIILISDNTPWNDVNQFKVGRAIDLNKPEDFVAFIEECAQKSDEEMKMLCDSIPDYLSKHFQFEKMKQDYMEMLFGNCFDC